MHVTLVLCTKNRGDRLGPCLSALEAMPSDPDTAVVFVDNGSTDDTPGRLRSYASTSRHRVTVIRAEAPGNSAGRNAALAIAGGGLVVFIDDDCYVDPGFVGAWRSVFLDDGLGYAGGMAKRFDPRHATLGCYENPDPRRFLAGVPPPRGVLQGSNMAFRTTCLADVGGFDPMFGAGTPFAGEEWEVMIRAARAGWAGGYFPGPMVWHDHQRLPAEAEERLGYYDFGAGAVYAKHLIAGRDGRLARTLLRDLYWLRSGARAMRMAAGARAFLSARAKTAS